MNRNPTSRLGPGGYIQDRKGTREQQSDIEAEYRKPTLNIHPSQKEHVMKMKNLKNSRVSTLKSSTLPVPSQQRRHARAPHSSQDPPLPSAWPKCQGPDT